MGTMSLTPLTIEPPSITAGDTLSWLITLADYPASYGWTLKYNAISASGRFAIASSASGDDHSVTVAKATSAAYPAGNYTLVKYVESATELITLAELPLVVRPNLAGTTVAYDNRSHVKKVLDAIEAVLEGAAATDQQEITIDGTALKRRTVADLLKLRGQYLQYYQQELSAANISKGLGSGQKILVRFT